MANKTHPEADSEQVSTPSGPEGEQELASVEVEPIESTSSQSQHADIEQLIGRKIADRYLVKRCIGVGGMGVVYLAEHEQLSRKVVVKTIRRSDLNDESDAKRFEREALGLSQLDHPNIVTIYDFGHEGTLSYIVMEFVDGGTLRQVMKNTGPMVLADFGLVAIQILDAVGEAHRRGLIHRDLKPSNIMLCEKQGKPNFVKVLDFGLAKLLRDGAELTQKDTVIGSVSYMAPEQILGMDVDTRADVYALGVLFYQMLSGEKPFKGGEMGVLYQHVHSDPPHLSEVLPADHDIPKNVIDLVHVCLSKDPDDRPRNANMVQEMLRGAVDASDIFASPWSGARHLSPGSGEFYIPTEGSSSRSRQVPQAGEYSGVISKPLLQENVEQATADPSSNKLKIALAAVGLVALLGVGFAAMNMGAENDGADEQAQAQQQEDSARSAREALDRVDALIKKGSYAQAKMILDSTKDSRKGNPELLEQEARLRVAIDLQRLMQKAAEQSEHAQFDEAMATYRKVLEQDGNHADAKKALAELESYPVVTVTSTPAASLWVDGERVGQTPIDHRLAPGEHTLELSVADYQKWTETYELAVGDHERIQAKLQKAGGSAGARRDRPKARPRQVERSQGRKPKASAGAKPATKTSASTKETKEPKRKIDLLMPADEDLEDDSVPMMGIE
ncbi:PEGA domain-containing protein [Persicimonas caeni]|uniref:PEGA domain-containing protein n=1 Tax=Persicimonas caeni TaxID=2292766 RepID=A0A4Y6PUT7_PERCE|nr:serine/threonine-protein kinase [Persicimonas caeni]QDG52013.1 PEGA domain-containing protein [Persicimonas caeni]QED33234.1 protein kinase [Persicimonas caeni]